MVSSADISILFKLSELAQRCGLRPSDAVASIDSVDNGTDPYCERLTFTYTNTGEPEHMEKISLFQSLLGLPVKDCNDQELRTDWVPQLEDIVDKALDHAPRPRYR